MKKNPAKPDMPALAANHRGYLLIEALIAMTIFAVGFMAIGKMVIFTTRSANELLLQLFFNLH